MLLKVTKNPNIITHSDADLDAICSCLMLENYYLQLGKSPTIINFGEINKNYQKKLNFKFENKLNINESIVLVACKRKNEALINSENCDINIDHQNGNQLFADLNIIDKKACSTTEILWKIIPDHYKNQEIAEICLIGIYSETNFLKSDKVQSRTYLTCKEIFKYKPDLNKINNIIKKDCNSETLKKLGETLLKTEHKNHNLDSYKENTIKINDADIIKLIEINKKKVSKLN